MFAGIIRANHHRDIYTYATRVPLDRIHRALSGQPASIYDYSYDCDYDYGCVHKYYITIRMILEMRIITVMIMVVTIISYVLRNLYVKVYVCTYYEDNNCIESVLRILIYTFMNE